MKSSKNCIALCGFMGCGKTTVGRRLADNIGYGFTDLDQAVEASAGMSIPAIFSAFSESRFRDLEHAAIKSMQNSQRMVVALGGGAVLFKRNVDILRSFAQIVYLEVPANHLIKRLARSKDRPLLQSAGWQEKVHSLLESRLPLYLQAADHTVSGIGRPEKVAARVADICGLS